MCESEEPPWTCPSQHGRRKPLRAKETPRANNMQIRHQTFIIGAQVSFQRDSHEGGRLWPHATRCHCDWEPWEPRGVLGTLDGNHRSLDMVDTGELFGDPRSIRGILFYPGTSMGQHQCQCPRIADHHFNTVLVHHDSVPLWLCFWSSKMVWNRRFYLSSWMLCLDMQHS